MKRFITTILAAILIVPFMQSCEKSGAEQPDKSVLATVLPYWNEVGFACQLDNGETLYPGKLRIKYEVNSEAAQRAIIYFSEINSPVQGFTYNADIFNIINVPTKEIETLKNAEDDIYKDALKVDKIAISGDYLNVEYTVLADPNTNNRNEVYLFDNVSEGTPEYEDYYPLELKVKCTPSVSGSKGRPQSYLACFYIGAYKLSRLGCDGYHISYKDLDSGEVKTYTVKP